MSTPRVEQRSAGEPSLREAVVVLAVLGLVLLAVFATYARLPGDELYRTTHNGVSGGASKALVFLNYPTALVALAVLTLAVDRLRPRAPRVVTATATAAVAAALCAVVAVPGVVSPEHVGAKPINVLPALGVLLVLALLVRTLRADGLGIPHRRVRGDALRAGIAAVLVLWSVPWMFAEVGLFAPWPFLSDVVPPGEIDAAVHAGRHHGTDGVLLALTALALSRPLTDFRSHRLASVAASYLSVMLTYGVANAAQDGWNEQVAKRGWTDVELPNLTQPSLSIAWVAILLTAALVYRFWFRPERRTGDETKPSGSSRAPSTSAGPEDLRRRGRPTSA